MFRDLVLFQSWARLGKLCMCNTRLF